MNKCINCKSIVLDDTKTCPLCHTVMQEHEGDIPRKNEYPDISEKRRRFSLTLRFILFGCILITAVCGFINYTLDYKHPWALIVGVCLFYFYYLFKLFSDTYAGYMKRIFFAIITAVIGTVLIDFGFGFKRWSVNYVLPGALFFLTLSLIILMIVNRRNWQSYMMFQVIFIFIAACPLISIKVGLVTRPLVSELALMACILLFVGTLIFGGREAHQELKRRFHI